MEFDNGSVECFKYGDAFHWKCNAYGFGFPFQGLVEAGKSRSRDGRGSRGVGQGVCIRIMRVGGSNAEEAVVLVWW